MPKRIEEHWSEIRRVVAQGQSSAVYCSVASINPDGTPNISPIGRVFLSENMTGYYFDPYTSALSRNLDINPNICAMHATVVDLALAEQGRQIFGWPTVQGGLECYGIRPGATRFFDRATWATPLIEYLKTL